MTDLTQEYTDRLTYQKHGLPDGFTLQRGDDGMVRYAAPPSLAGQYLVKPDASGDIVTPDAASAIDSVVNYIADIGQGFLQGAARGAHEFNKILPGAPAIEAMGGAAFDAMGIDSTINPPTTIPGQLASGLGQALPGMIPAMRALKMAGYGPAVADIVGGIIGDFATSGKTEADGIAEMIAMIPGDKAQEISQIVSDFVTSDNATIQDLNSRLVGALPGAVLGPLVNGLGSLVAMAKNSGAAQDIVTMISSRWAEGKSPVPVGMSIEEAPLVLPRGSNAPTENEIALAQNSAEMPGDAQNAIDAISRVRGAYPTGASKDRFAPIEVTGGKFKTEKGSRVFEPKVKEQAYNFHIPPEGKTVEQWQSKLAKDMAKDVQSVVERAKAGDRAAKSILSEARWYRDMRTRLRQEFGGLGDVFADLLGTTSAQTNVRDNFKNSIEILKSFTRGDFDAEIAAWQAREASGETMNPTVLQQMHKREEFPLITNAAGRLFNANSPASMKALLDTFRDIKTGSAPKTPNFTGNLIGYSNNATVDVWAARYLRNKAGLPYIPPPAEKAVAGTHLTGSTIDDPNIGSEFGFGQKVFQEAVDKINKAGLVKGYDPSIGDMGADDLQAVVWFLEKEKWTNNGWTNKAGEGGSLDYEASLAGAADPARVEELRAQARASFKEPARRKSELDDEYSQRVDDAFSEHVARTANADGFVQDAAAPVDRTILGVSAERPGKTPSNYEQAEMAAEFDDVLRGDDTVTAYKITNTYGNFAGVNERSLDAEIITRQGFNPQPLKDRLVQTGIEKDQDAVFISKVVTNPAPGQKVNPGMELYFTKKQQAAFAEDMAARLRERGIDGFTFITDARQADRINVQARAQDGSDTAGITGLRVQYIPEFDGGGSPQRAQEMEDIFFDIAEEYAQRGDISAANVVHYSTEVFKHPDASRVGWIIGGKTYDQARGNASATGKAPTTRQQGSANAPRPNSNAGAGADQ
jgi:hypothetical protein